MIAKGNLMANLNLDEQRMQDVLSNARTIAVVGHSDNPSRTSYQIAAYLRRKGYTVYPVNPTLSEIEGEKFYASLNELPEKVDIVNIFRRSEHVAGVVDEAIAASAKAIWAQLDVIDWAARDKALAAGLDVAMDLCIKVEHSRMGLG
jgi:predicted CoA-binding protein